MFGGVNPKQMNAMMKKMGIKTDEIFFPKYFFSKSRITIYGIKNKIQIKG